MMIPCKSQPAIGTISGDLADPCMRSGQSLVRLDPRRRWHGRVARFWPRMSSVSGPQVDPVTSPRVRATRWPLLPETLAEAVDRPLQATLHGFRFLGSSSPLAPSRSLLVVRGKGIAAHSVPFEIRSASRSSCPSVVRTCAVCPCVFCAATTMWAAR